MENYLNNPIEYADKIEKMYPDAYTRIYPHVQYLVNSHSDEGMSTLTNENINQITEEALRRSNVINDPPAGHNMNSMRDMTRAFVVRDFHDRDRRRGLFPFFSPFFFFPFDLLGRDRFRDSDRDHDRDRDRNHNRDHDRDRERDRGHNDY